MARDTDPDTGPFTGCNSSDSLVVPEQGGTMIASLTKA